MQRTPFPRYLDQPKMLGMFQMDEVFTGMGVFFVIFFIGFSLGWASSITMIGGLVMMILSAIALRKYKRNFPDNFMFHMMYRKGLFHPVLNDARKKKRFDIRNGSKIIPTGYVKYFYE